MFIYHYEKPHSMLAAVNKKELISPTGKLSSLIHDVGRGERST